MTQGTQGRLSIGIDIGGTGIKAALVDIVTGKLLFKRVRVFTPKPSTPEAVAQAITEVYELLVARALESECIDDRSVLDALPLGCGFPGVVCNGRVEYIANLDKRWREWPIEDYLREQTGKTVHLMNDADAAGLAEMSFGAGTKFRKKTVLMTTLGTGIGTALFTQGRLVPYTEFGHIEMNGRDAETQAAESVKVREGLEYSEWAERLQQYYSMMELLVCPDLIIVGGGVSKSHQQFLPLIKTRAQMEPAKYRNDSGTIGAAVLAANRGKAKVRKRKKAPVEAV